MVLHLLFKILFHCTERIIESHPLSNIFFKASKHNRIYVMKDKKEGRFL